MIKISRPPAQRGYSVDMRSSALQTDLRGGLNRARKDQSRPDYRASLSYTIPAREAPSWAALYDRLAMTGEAFQVDLIADAFALTPYECKLVPGSFQIAYIDGARARVSYQADATPDPSFTPASDEALMDLFETYGEDADSVLALLAQLVNEDLPN